ncbi:MAG: hypothetical protein QOG68_544 [Solirubrobacteraceae bacterium]|nr:hypothetical protein [Solirubrobacteraceae bacterium]
MSSVAVIVATRNRPAELSACLTSLAGQSLPADRVVVVDDDPANARTAAVVASFAGVRYLAGGSLGLAAAHNAGLRATSSDILAFTDDDVVADQDWLRSLVTGFDGPGVGCVTGQIQPLELATDAQRLLEAYARFDKGDARRVFDLEGHRPPGSLFPFAVGAVGSGANMAFTRRALDDIGWFDPALGAGTRAAGGDDLSAFFEVLLRGYRIVYEPTAVVHHRHAREMSSLRRQVYGYGVGLTAYLTRTLLAHPRLGPRALRGVPAALRHILGSASAKNRTLPPGYPARLRWAERAGMLVGPVAYLASRLERRQT